MTTKKTAKPTVKPEVPEVPEVPEAPVKGDLKGLWIEAVSEQGRWRAGHRWPRKGEGVALHTLSTEVIAELKADPMLRVKEVTFSDEEKASVIHFEQLQE